LKFFSINAGQPSYISPLRRLEIAAQAKAIVEKSREREARKEAKQADRQLAKNKKGT